MRFAYLLILLLGSRSSQAISFPIGCGPCPATGLYFSSCLILPPVIWVGWFQVGWPVHLSPVLSPPVWDRSITAGVPL